LGSPGGGLGSRPSGSSDSATGSAAGAAGRAMMTSVSHCVFDLVGYKLNQEKKNNDPKMNQIDHHYQIVSVECQYILSPFLML
jgi:hypothetical protein